MNLILIGNIIALIASFLILVISYLKEKKNIIKVQTLQVALLAISNLVLGGYTGAITNAITVIRNILCYKEKLNKVTTIIIATSITILGLVFNNSGVIGLLPLISTIIYTLFINTKDPIKLKLLILMNLVFWGIYDFAIKSYTSAFFEFTGTISSIITIIQMTKENKKYKIKEQLQEA